MARDVSKLMPTSVSGYYCDKVGRIIVNTNQAELEAYMAAREALLANKESEDKLNSLKSELDELKAMLKTVINNKQS